MSGTAVRLAASGRRARRAAADHPHVTTLPAAPRATARQVSPRATARQVSPRAEPHEAAPAGAGGGTSRATARGAVPLSADRRVAARASVPARLVRAGGLRAASGLHGPRHGARILPVHDALRALLPDGGLRRGSSVAVATATGGLSLLYALLAAASADGAWCATVGVGELGAVSAAEYGVATERFAAVPDPGPDRLSVTGALLDGFDLVVLRPAGPTTPATAGRLAARARQRGAVLLVHGDWPGADVALRTSEPSWQGLGDGAGRLTRRTLRVESTGRRVTGRPRRARLLLPAGATGVGAVAPAPAPGRCPARPVPVPDDGAGRRVGAGRGEAVG